MLKSIIIGDSQAGGLAAPLKELLRSVGINVVYSDHHVGQQTIWFAREQIVKNAVDHYKPDLVILIMGGNDAQRSIESWLPGVRNVVAQAKSRGARIVWIGTAFSTDPNVQARHQLTSNWQEATLPQLGITWIHSMPMTQGGHGPDGVHFTRNGYRAWATTIADELAILPSNSFPWIPLAIAAIVGIMFIRIVR